MPVLLLLAVYQLPAFLLAYMGVEILVRNPRQKEHRVASLVLFTTSLMFLEEFVRQSLPTSLSPLMLTYVFINLRALSAAFAIHFYAILTGWTKRLPSWVYLPLCYLPIIPSLLILVLRHNIYTSMAFTRVDMWIQPVYNKPYYIVIWSGILIIGLLSLLTHDARRRAVFHEAKQRLSVLFYATLFVLVWHIVFGVLLEVLPVFNQLPPFPYLFGDVVWLFFLRWAMVKHDLLPPFGRKYQSLFELVPSAILVSDEHGNILEANATAKRLFGENHTNLFDLPVRTDQTSLREQFFPHFQTRNKVADLETEVTQANGNVVSVLVDADFVEVDGQLLSIVMIRDITERKQAERRIAKLAYYDSLTELPNRPHFYRLLAKAMEEARESGEKFGLILIDVDNFKDVNDSLGHQTGDDAIQYVAQVLHSALPPPDVVARLGGDEFVVIVHPCPDLTAARHIAEKIIRAFEQPCLLDGNMIQLSVSIGVSLFPDHGSTQHSLIKRADFSMYEAKQEGRRRYVISRPPFEP